MNTNDIQLRKLKVMEMLMQVRSEQLVERMEKLLEKEMIVAYTTDGKPLTLKAYNKRLEKAEKQIQEGKVITHEELKERIKKW